MPTEIFASEVESELFNEFQEWWRERHPEGDNTREVSEQPGQPPSGGGGGGGGVIVAEHDHHDPVTGGARITPSTLNNTAIGQYVTLSGTQTLTNKTITAPTLNSYADFSEIAVPATAPANTLRLFVEDFKGFTFFSFIDSTGMVRKIVRDSVFVGKNVTGTAIPAMSPVYASGSSGNVPTLALAKADSAATMPSIGITVEAIADQAHGRVMQVGLLEGVNTNAFTEGNVLYVSAATAGALTATAPTFPNIAQEVGTVLVKSIGAGAIQCIARSMLNLSPVYVPLTSPLTSTSWDGDAYSTTAKTLIDLSAVFSAPAGIKAIDALVVVRDSASAGGDYWFILSPNSATTSGKVWNCERASNDSYRHASQTVPCDANGDVYYQVNASGASTMDVIIQIWGYWV